LGRGKEEKKIKRKRGDEEKKEGGIWL